MSQLILKWLSEDIKLSRRVGEFEKDFANGYLYAEILHARGLVPDLDSYVDASNMTAKQHNFAKLKAVLAGGDLGFSLKDSQISEIMAEDRGSSLRLLFQLKQSLAQRARGVVFETAQTKADAMKEAAMRLHAGNTSQPTKRIEKTTRNVRAEHDERFFQEQMKTLRPLDVRVPHRLHVKKFVDEHTRQIGKADEERRVEKEDLLERQSTFRKSQMEAMQQSRALKKETNLKGEQCGLATKVRMLAAVEHDLNFEKHTIKREIAKVDRIRANHIEDCGYSPLELHKGPDDELRGIAWFEKNLQRIGIDTSGEGAPPGASGAAAKKAEPKPRSKDEGRKPRKPLSACRMSLREASAADGSADEFSMIGAQELLAELRRDTESYGQEAMEYDLDVRHGQAEVCHRASLQQAVAARAERNSEEAYQRMATQCREEREQTLAQQREESPKSRRGTRRRHAHTQMLTDSSEEEDARMMSPASATSRRSTRLSLFTPGTDAVDDDEQNLEHVQVPLDKIMGCVTEPRTSAYIFERGSWASLARLARDSRAGRPKLGCFVRSVLTPQPASVGEPRLPPSFLPIIVVGGSPAALDEKGLSMAVAKRIGKEHDFAVIEPQKVAAEFMALTRQDPPAPAPEWPTLARAYKLGEMLVKNDASIEPSLYVELVFRKLELLAAPPPKAEEDAGAKAKAKAKPKAKGKGAAEEEEEAELENPKGAVVVGLPPDLRFQAAWAEALQAYALPVFAVRDSPEDQHLQLSDILAPWLPAYARTDEGCCYQPKLPIAAAVSPAVCFLDLCHASQESLGGAVLASQGAERQEPAAPPCAGLMAELSSTPHAADRAWLFDEARGLSRAFAGPLGSRAEVVGDAADAESAESEALARISEFLARRAAAEEAPAPEAAEAEEEEAAEDKEAEGCEEAAAEEAAEEEAPKPVAPRSLGAEPWKELEEEHLAKLKDHWLQCLSDYFVGLSELFTSADGLYTRFGANIVSLQKKYLDHLQREDTKGNLVIDFIRTWTMQEYAGTPKDGTFEHLDDLSDRMWQFVDHRRAEAVEELSRLMTTDGFWEAEVNGVLRLTRDLLVLEWQRYEGVESILLHVYGHGDLVPLSHEDVNEEPPVDISTSQDIADWLQQLAEALLKRCVNLSTKQRQVCKDGVEEPTEEAEDGAAASSQFHRDLTESLRVHKAEFDFRMQVLRAWARNLIAGHRTQLDDVFSRMDDWIRDRIRNENEAIREALLQLGAGAPPEVIAAIRDPAVDKRKNVANVTAIKKWRREIVNLLAPKPLKVDIYEVQPRESETTSEKLALGLTGVAAERWHFPMLSGLAGRLGRRVLSEGSSAVLDPAALFEVLLEQQASAFRFESQSVPPAWVQRSETAIHTLCQGFVAPEWGALAVDVTEVLMSLTMQGRGLAWPTLDALLASRTLIETHHGGPSSGFPDVPVNMDLFLKLPLWEGAENTLLGWVFRVLVCLEDERNPCFPSDASSSCDGATVSARRLFTYLGLGATPSQGLSNLFALLLPRPKARDEESKPEVLVPELWKVVFSVGSRPTGSCAEPRDLEPFCRELVPPPPPPEAAAPEKGKKGQPAAEASPEPLPQGPPEETLVALDVDALLVQPAILRALCTHGGLLCRKRALATLFHGVDGEAPPLRGAAQAAGLQALEMLVDAPGTSTSPAPET